MIIKYSIIIASFIFLFNTQTQAQYKIKLENNIGTENLVSACQFTGYSVPVPDLIWQNMKGQSWHPNMGCPPKNKLRYVRLQYNDFAMRPKMGELIVARSEATKVIRAFKEIFCSRSFSIARMKLIFHYKGNDRRSMNHNNTSAFNCRTTTRGGRLSEHAYGKAIDINPLQNPYVKGKFTSPRLGKKFDTSKERHGNHIGVIKKGDVVTKAFAKIGWKWGGNWRRSRDYQHFSYSGR